MTRAILAVAVAACVAGGRLESGVVFARYTPLASNAEIARRTLPPLTYRRVQQTLAATGQKLADQAIDLAKERFDIYVPAAAAPAAGYGLVVFVAPWDDATQPRMWRTPLDRHGLVFVAARDSGNERSVLDRRLPLALLAYANARARFPIDPSRVYVWGFSGGSRVAELAALAYPDVFRGALLEAGADPIDTGEGIYKPSAALFHQFQRTRIVVVTGDDDVDIQRQDDRTLRSLRDACVLDVTTSDFHGGHEALDAGALGRALDLLEAPHPPDPATLARCNERVDRDLAERVAAAKTRADLLAIERAYGGLAAPQLLELDGKL